MKEGHEDAHAVPHSPDEAVVIDAKSAVAAAITATLAGRRLTMRAAAAELRLDAADVQRIRNGDIAGFTLDRLVRVASRLDYRIELHLLPATAAGVPADAAALDR